MRDNYCFEESAHIEREILAYLCEHPEAWDTVEGIAEWWIMEQNIRKRSREVKEAIADLVKKGFVIERQMTDSRYFYQINPEMNKKILTWIRQRSEANI